MAIKVTNEMGLTISTMYKGDVTPINGSKVLPQVYETDTSILPLAVGDVWS
ncbi:hypothetical protein TorRG33x02_182770, partial [Trema orientale]